MNSEGDLTAEQQTRMIGLVVDLPWGDVEGAICGLEEALRLTLEATAEAFSSWDDVATDIGVADEFSLSHEQVQDLSPEERLAYVARLVRSLALNYGVNAGFGEGPLVGNESAESPAGILRGLNEISWMPLVDASTQSGKESA